MIASVTEIYSKLKCSSVTFEWITWNLIVGPWLGLNLTFRCFFQLTIYLCVTVHILNDYIWYVEHVDMLNIGPWVVFRVTDKLLSSKKRSKRKYLAKSSLFTGSDVTTQKVVQEVTSPHKKLYRKWRHHTKSCSFSTFRKTFFKKLSANWEKQLKI
jgi:hypothetical protein